MTEIDAGKQAETEMVETGTHSPPVGASPLAEPHEGLSPADQQERDAQAPAAEPIQTSDEQAGKAPDATRRAFEDQMRAEDDVDIVALNARVSNLENIVGERLDRIGDSVKQAIADALGASGTDMVERLKRLEGKLKHW